MKYFATHFIRCAMFTGIAVFALLTVDHMFTVYCDVELASIQEDRQFAGTIGDCATDTECRIAESAAVMAVAKERGLGSNGGGGQLNARR